MPEVPKRIPLDQIAAALARGNQPQEHRPAVGFTRLRVPNREQTQGYETLGKTERPGASTKVDTPMVPEVRALEPYPDADRMKYPLVSENGRRLVVTISNMVAGSSDPVNISCYVSSEHETKKLPGTTTSLFRRAREVMQVEADRSNRVLVYTFRTNYPALQAWALDPDKGADIFDWTILESNQAYNFRARATIHPHTSGTQN